MYLEISYVRILEDKMIMIVKSTIVLSPEAVSAILSYWYFQSPRHGENIISLDS